MKIFGIFIRKEFWHIFRDKRTLLILFGMPVVQVILFGFAITNEIKEAKIAILDKSHDHLTRQISNKLLSSGYFILYSQPESDNQLEKAFQEGKTKLAVVFEPEFAQRLNKDRHAGIQLIADATDPNTANMLIGYASAIIRNWQMDFLGNPKLPYTITPEVKMVYNPEMKSVFMFVPGVITIILMLVSAMMTSIAVTREKELGTMEVLLASPIKPFFIIVGKVIPYLVLSLFNASVILMLGTFLFGMPIEGNLLLLMAEVTLFIITSLALGIFISTRTSSQQTAMMISLMALMLPTIILSGFIFPVENMPLPLQVISNIIPAKWFIIIVKSIMLKGVGLGEILKETLILTGMAAFFIALSVKNFKIRLE
ncbi:MAG: ABC transporter permease [Bacteroidia bacterium]|nr:ABC transporter permease [Bacteroidia bacterium]